MRCQEGLCDLVGAYAVVMDVALLESEGREDAQAFAWCTSDRGEHGCASKDISNHLCPAQARPHTLLVKDMREYPDSLAPPTLLGGQSASRCALNRLGRQVSAYSRQVPVQSWDAARGRHVSSNCRTRRGDPSEARQQPQLGPVVHR